MGAGVERVSAGGVDGGDRAPFLTGSQEPMMDWSASALAVTQFAAWIGDMSADSVAASATRTFVGTRDFRAFGVERVFHGHAGHRLRIGHAKASQRSSWS